MREGVRDGCGSLVALAVLTGAPPTWAQTRWRPDERVIIADFSHIDAVAVGRTNAFAATANGLVAYDRRFGRWGLPVTTADGYPAARVVAAAVDLADESLWLGTREGLVHYRPELREIEEVAVPGGVTDITFDRDDPARGLYLRSSTGWQFLGRGQLFPKPTAQLPRTRWGGPGSLAAVIQRFPMAETMGVSVLIDRQLRQYHYTAAAVAPEGSEVFFGTDGLGLVRLDPTAARLERLPFGLSGSSVGAIAATGSEVWVGVEDGQGFVRVDRDLSAFQEERDPAYPLRRVRDLTVRGRVLWAATDRGLLRIEPGGKWRLVEGGVATAVAATPRGVWVGTDRGLAIVRGDSVTRVGPAGIQVLSLLPAHDSVWVGSAQGLLLAASDTGDLLAPAGPATEPQLREPIVALAQSRDVLVAATPVRILWQWNGTAWTVERVMSAELGTISALAADTGGVWVGGQSGMGFFRFSGRSFVSFRVPGDVPGPVRDLAASGAHLWVATERGLVRFLRRALIP